ncbi:MAG: LexA repressor [candidate division WS6 bacterium OLB20]|uniref:LexA repressor n=1 Tax=candidate division WS6 bacterium OLB20 TaxID=1617426 RepID=A0A136LZA6_9BACT|nr:MAG: LexA repressor [candidate division WS6 bacterium OLB20]
MNQARSVRAVESKMGVSGIAEIPVLGAIAEYGQVKRNARTRIVVLHESVLPFQGTFFALNVLSEVLDTSIARKGDILVFSEQDAASDGDLVVIERSPEESFFGSLGYQKDKIRLSFAAQGKEAELFNNVQIRGKAVTLIRSIT